MAQRQRSDAQALAAFGPAGVEHSPATAGLHAHEEAVRTGAADLGRLVGALHGRPVSVVAAVAGLEVGEFKPGLPPSLLPAWFLAESGQETKVGERIGNFGPFGAHTTSHLLRKRPRFESGKPTITAKIAFAVKHLHHKTQCSTGVDDASVCVDNCDPPIARDA